MSTSEVDLDIFQEFASMIGKLLGDEDAPGTSARSPMGQEVSARCLT